MAFQDPELQAYVLNHAEPRIRRSKVSSVSFASIELEFTPPWPLLSLLIAWFMAW